MQTFTYSFIFQLVFRFGNIFVTILLLIYITPLVVLVDQQKLLLIPLIISVIIIYIINKTYLTYYKIIPYKIEADEEKMTCSNFLFSSKVFTIHYDEIDELKGGVFDGKSTGVMKLRDGRNKVQIGFSYKIKNSERLISLILSKVPKEQYNAVIEQLMKKRGMRYSSKRKGK